jgi:uncharacterized protein YuzE
LFFSQDEQKALELFFELFDEYAQLEPNPASVKISPNITAELNASGELIGVEIINASTYTRDSILESVQGKLLNLVRGEL